MSRSYRNGEVPSSRLISFHSGWNSTDGAWTHSLPPATYRKHLALVALAKRNTGRDLEIGVGWCAYRPIAAQRMLKKRFGIMAATPGTSSHGGFWEGAEVMAIDYSNWSHVYNGDRAKWFRDVRAVGFAPDQISPRRGYPDEPWHVIDRDPWASVPSGGANESEEDDMTPEEHAMLESVRDAIFFGGKSMKDGGRSISASLADLVVKVGPIKRDGKQVSLRQEIADTKTMVIQLQATQAGLEGALTALANAKGLDASAILKAAQSGVENALRKVTFTADIDG